MSAAIRLGRPSSKSFRIWCSSLSTVSTSTQTSVEALLRTSLRLFLIVYKLTFTKEGSVIQIAPVFVLLLFFSMTLPVVSRAQSPTSEKPFVVEYYYKTKWGHVDEFLKLFKKNHYPVLKKEMETGRIAKVWMDQPRYHTTEDGRWIFA